jgi:hypothetical protein
LFAAQYIQKSSIQNPHQARAKRQTENIRCTRHRYYHTGGNAISPVYAPPNLSAMPIIAKVRTLALSSHFSSSMPGCSHPISKHSYPASIKIPAFLVTKKRVPRLAPQAKPP